jgi:hypothetical protein
MRGRIVVSLGVVALFAGGAARADAATLVVSAAGVGGSVGVTAPVPLGGPVCGPATCAYGVPDGTRVTLTASVPSPAPYRAFPTSFAGWLGACAGSGPSCGLTVTAQTVTTAQFSPVQLMARATDGGRVAVAPKGAPCGGGCWLYRSGTPVAISQGAFPGNAFDRWFGPCGAGTTSALCRLTLLQSADVQAIFRCTGDVCSLSSPLSRSVNVTLRVTGGKVRWNALTSNGSQQKTCPGTCSFSARRATSVALSAASGSARPRWSGLCQNAGATCTFSAFGDASGKGPVVSAGFR